MISGDALIQARSSPGESWVDVIRLAERPNLDHLHAQAKHLLAGLREERPQTTLALAQAELAAQYGFRTWAEMKNEVARLRALPATQEVVVGSAIADLFGLGPVVRPRTFIGPWDGEAVRAPRPRGRDPSDPAPRRPANPCHAAAGENGEGLKYVAERLGDRENIVLKIYQHVAAKAWALAPSRLATLIDSENECDRVVIARPGAGPEKADEGGLANMRTWSGARI